MPRGPRARASRDAPCGVVSHSDAPGVLLMYGRARVSCRSKWCGVLDAWTDLNFQ